MPRYDAKRIEAKWQRHWDENQTFRTPDSAPGKKKLYVLDMFPYPSGDGLHVGHPEGYTATDIVCRFERMRGRHVLHPMGWDAFGLPAEQHAIKTGTPPRITTYKNIDTFRRQLKMLGFSYDWSREFSTTDPDYFRWTQWIFLVIFDSWYDRDCEWTGPDGVQRKGRGRPISELPIPDDIRAQGDEAVRRYQDKHRLAYQHFAPVNWCPALGTVLANEEVIDGKSERGSHPVTRIAMRQWMLRITDYAERLLDELADLDWTESIKTLQRNWIGRSEGAEVDFYIGALGAKDPQTGFESWKKSRTASGFLKEPSDDVLRIYTTRPDTLFGATYMVLAPEHPFVDRLTTPEQKSAVEKYRQQAAGKSDLDRTDLAKDKTGVFTGAHAVNPVNGQQVPIWIADYVLISYGTGAIMAVPAHDQRDMEFAQQMSLPIKEVVEHPPEDQYSRAFLDYCHQYFGQEPYSVAVEIHSVDQKRTLRDLVSEVGKLIANYDQTRATDFQNHIELHTVGSDLFLLIRKPLAGITKLNVPAPYKQIGLNEAFTFPGIAINSGQYDGLPTAEFKKKISADLAAGGLGKAAVNYRLRDWLFSRQHFWGEPFPVWHELDANGEPTGLLRAVPVENLPVTLPEMQNFHPTGKPEPPLAKAPDDWLYKTDTDGTRLMRETNTMPQWAGSCWYYLRFTDPKNAQQFVDPAVEKYWMPVDLYIGGAEHAVLHLLYSRFWHKILFDRGHVCTPEPFRKLVNQGMILGEAELTGYQDSSGNWVSARNVREQDDPNSGETQWVNSSNEKPVKPVSIEAGQVEKKGEDFVLIENSEIAVQSRAYKMSKSRGNVINPDHIVAQYGADALRMYEMFMGPLEAAKPWSMSGVDGISRFLGRVWRMVIDDRANDVQLSGAVQDVAPTEDQLRVLHKTIKAVTEDYEKLSFNTAISRMMEFTNEIGPQEPRPKSVLEQFVLLLSPLAPHIAEELWEVLGHKQSLAYESWPKWDAEKIAESEIEVPVQVNGKLRGKVKVPAEADEATIRAAAESDAAIASNLAGKQVVKVIIVPGRLVNFVVKG